MPYYNSLTQPTLDRWFSFPKPAPRAKLRLFCFPHAGSGANIFYKWHRLLPGSVELCLVHLPGREHRLNEKPFDRMAELTRALGRALLPYLDKPIALFGHSLGALVGFELSRELRRNYGLEPAHLFVSGCCAPKSVHMPSGLHSLPAPLFLDGLRRLGVEPDPLYDNAEFLEVLLPTLRADLAVCETYSYANEPLLDCGISVFGGIKDHNVKYEYLKAWQKETTGPFALHMFAGGHYFNQTSEVTVLKVLSEELATLASEESDADLLLMREDRCA